ncbi:MAG: DUF1207 domain-containing protein [Bacteroidales bacterium]|nr:DUF1207 domain-containing protein [Bacteroidales bacterium]
MSKLFKIFLILLISNQINAQKPVWFQTVKFGNPFISDIRSPIIKSETGYLNNIGKYYYIKNVSTRPFIEAHFGYEIPVISLSKNNYEIFFGLPGGSVTLVDMFEKTTAPVINTDYWFGTEIKFIKRFQDKKYIKNIGLNILPLFHESTHLGDEFILNGFTKIPDFKRINISYEAWKFSVILNDPDTLNGNILSLKASIQNLWTLKDGWYFTDSLEVKGANIPLSKKTFEWYFSANYQRIKGLLCSEKWVNIFSVQVNNRIQFSYEPNIPEKRIWSYNLYFGWKYKISDKAFRNVGFFLRYYRGLNPHGQFRNIGDYRFTGLSIALM